MKTLSAILLFDIALLCGANAEPLMGDMYPSVIEYEIRSLLANGEVSFVSYTNVQVVAVADEQPPMPPHDPVPMQLVALGDIPAAIVVDPTKPTERREIKDGQIIEWRGGSLQWFIEPDLFVVEHSVDLLSYKWEIIDIWDGETNAAPHYIVKMPSGFYRVRRINRPPPPPTHPPKQTPARPTAEQLSNIDTNRYAGGFRK